VVTLPHLGQVAYTIRTQNHQRQTTSSSNSRSEVNASIKHHKPIGGVPPISTSTTKSFAHREFATRSTEPRIGSMPSHNQHFYQHHESIPILFNSSCSSQYPQTTSMDRQGVSPYPNTTTDKFFHPERRHSPQFIVNEANREQFHESSYKETRSIHVPTETLSTAPPPNYQFDRYEPTHHMSSGQTFKFTHTQPHGHCGGHINSLTSSDDAILSPKLSVCHIENRDLLKAKILNKVYIFIYNFNIPINDNLTRLT
jgi:hypothetical protein